MVVIRMRVCVMHGNSLRDKAKVDEEAEKR
jgi:hypothetical protein